MALTIIYNGEFDNLMAPIPQQATTTHCAYCGNAITTSRYDRDFCRSICSVRSTRVFG